VVHRVLGQPLEPRRHSTCSRLPTSGSSTRCTGRAGAARTCGRSPPSSGRRFPT
jgi:hypothetical protein